MCVIVYKPKDKVLEKDTLRRCWERNSDGAGFTIFNERRKTLSTQKGFFNFKSFWKAYRDRVEDSEAIIHFRIATSGLIDAGNAHPFHMKEVGVSFAHNGVLPRGLWSEISNRRELEIKIKEKTHTRWVCSKSDTRIFADYYLLPLFKKFPRIWKEPEFRDIIQEAIGAGNKFAFLDSYGHIHIYNEKAGSWKEGCWFSNDLWDYPKRVNTRRNTGYTRGPYGQGGCYDYSDWRNRDATGDPDGASTSSLVKINGVWQNKEAELQKSIEAQYGATEGSLVDTFNEAGALLDEEEGGETCDNCNGPVDPIDATLGSPYGEYSIICIDCRREYYRQCATPPPKPFLKSVPETRPALPPAKK